MASFEERFKELKELHNVKNREIAELLGIGVRAVQFYDSGARKPDFDGLIKLAEFFNVNMDYLTGRSDDPTPPGSEEPLVSPEDMAFYTWVQEHVTGMHFYDFKKSMENEEWLKGLRIVYEREKGRKPGQKQGE